MTLSDLIANLTKLKEIHGDVPLEEFSFCQWDDTIEFGGFQVETDIMGRTKARPSMCWHEELNTNEE